MSYKISKNEKHDYASLSQKIIRKLHKLFYRMIGDRKKAYPFYRSYRHRNKKTDPNKEALTSHYMTEYPGYLAGFGHGLGAWRAGLVNAGRFGLSYAYTPMVNQAWEETLGLGENFPGAKDLLNRGYRKVLLPYYDMNDPASIELIQQIVASYRGENVVFYNEYEQWTGIGDDIEGDKELRRLFWSSSVRKKDDLIFSADKINVALHIRRGDVRSRLSQGDETMKKRWLELSYYEKIIDQISSMCADKERLRFIVFSEGEEKDFRSLTEFHSNITMCLNMSAEQSFLHLCYADILVTAPSSFSIIAGAINKGIKVVPDRDWLTIPNNEEWVKADSESGNILSKQGLEMVINQ